MKPPNDNALARDQGAIANHNPAGLQSDSSMTHRLQIIVSDADVKPVRALACLVVHAQRIDGELRIPSITLPEMPI